MDPKITKFQEKLANVQADLRERRAAAFVDYRPQVCGIDLDPVTFSSYSKLVAFQNAFVTGEPAGFKDIFQFIWVHRPEFGQTKDKARCRTLAQVYRALTPRFPTLTSLVHLLHPLVYAVSRRSGVYESIRPIAWFMGKIKTPTAAERHGEAAKEIRRLLKEALHDFPDAGDDAVPPPYAQKPYFISVLLRGYPMDFDKADHLVDHLPLKQLIEYIREILHRLSDGKNKLLHPEESRVWADYLAFKTAAASSAAVG